MNQVPGSSYKFGCGCGGILPAAFGGQNSFAKWMKARGRWRCRRHLNGLSRPRETLTDAQRKSRHCKPVSWPFAVEVGVLVFRP